VPGRVGLRPAAGVRAVKRSDREPDGRVFEGDLEALLRVHPRQLGTSNLRDVAGDADEALDLAERIDHGAHREQHFDLGAVLANMGPPTLVELAGERAMEHPAVGRDTKLGGASSDLLLVEEDNRVHAADHLRGGVAE